MLKLVIHGGAGSLEGKTAQAQNIHQSLCIIWEKTFEILQDYGSGKTFLPPFTTCNEKWSADKFRKAQKMSLPYAIKKSTFFKVLS